MKRKKYILKPFHALETIYDTFITLKALLRLTAEVFPVCGRLTVPAGCLSATERSRGSGCPGGPAIAAGAPRPHQKSSPLGPSFPSPSRRRPLSFCSSRPAGEGLWWLALSPQTSPERSAGDRRQDGWRENRGGRGKKRERNEEKENQIIRGGGGGQESWTGCVN